MKYEFLWLFIYPWRRGVQILGTSFTPYFYFFFCTFPNLEPPLLPVSISSFFHLKRFFSAYVSEVKKVYFMSRSFTEPAFSRTATYRVKQLTSSTQNTFPFQNCHSCFGWKSQKRSPERDYIFNSNLRGELAIPEKGKVPGRER